MFYLVAHSLIGLPVDWVILYIQSILGNGIGVMRLLCQILAVRSEDLGGILPILIRFRIDPILVVGGSFW